MNRQNIQQIIRELFRQYYKVNEGESFPLTDTGLMSEEGTMNAQEVAKGYWAERNEDEIERDDKAGVTEIDYVEWVMKELSELIPEQATLNINSDVWCQTTSRENNNPFPVVVLEVKGKTAIVKYRNYPTAEPFSVRVSSLYNP